MCMHLLLHLVTAMILVNSAIASAIEELFAFVVVVAACLQTNLFYVILKIVLIMIFYA